MRGGFMQETLESARFNVGCLIRKNSFHKIFLRSIPGVDLREDKKEFLEEEVALILRKVDAGAIHLFIATSSGLTGWVYEVEVIKT